MAAAALGDVELQLRRASSREEKLEALMRALDQLEQQRRPLMHISPIAGGGADLLADHAFVLRMTAMLHGVRRALHKDGG